MYEGTLAIAGEFMCTRTFSMHDEPNFRSLLEVLRTSDTAYAHFEMNLIARGEGYPGRAYALSALRADPVVGKDLRWAGVNIVSCAYNHALDWGIPGVVDTARHLDAAGIVHAGTGLNLEEASEPAYFESPAGRVALVSFSTGHHPYDSASAAKSPVRGRPGVNPMRIVQKHRIDPATLETMKTAWATLGMSTTPRWWMELEDGDVCFSVGDHGGGDSYSFIFSAHDKPEIVSTLHEADLERNLRSIRDARRQADLVLVAHHAAVNDGHRSEDPAKMVPPLAKQCIDAGADAFIGHGWHMQLGIEMYKDRPIFYGTGNFFAQSPFIEHFPADTYEGQGMDLAKLQTLTPADLHDQREENIGHHHRSQPWGVVPKLRFVEGKVASIELHPYTLGGRAGCLKPRSTGARMDGRPMTASLEEAAYILGEVRRLSKKFGTKVDDEEGVGYIAI